MTETGRLEAHEMWEFDYENGVGTVTDIVPLCHYCHNFIHSGRLCMVMGEEKTRDEVRAILEHGFKILAENNLKAFSFHSFLRQGMGGRHSWRSTLFYRVYDETKWMEDGV